MRVIERLHDEHTTFETLMATTQAPKKITPAVATKPAAKPITKSVEGEEVEKAGRESFIDSLNAEGKKALLNAEGKLTAMPSITLCSPDETTVNSYNPRKHAVLKRTDFTDEAMHLEFKGGVIRVRAEAMLERANEFAQRADEMRKFGDPETRKAMRRRDALMKQLAAIDKKLAAEGIEVEEGVND